MGQEKVITVVIDTNVVISALLFGGTPGKLVALWQKGQIEPIISEEIITEYLRVLTYPKFKLSEEEINYIIDQEILPFFNVVKSETGPSIIHKDPDDDRFIRCAQTGKAETIISGDRHLLALKSYQGINILTPAQFFRNNKLE